MFHIEIENRSSQNFSGSMLNFGVYITYNIYIYITPVDESLAMYDQFFWGLHPPTTIFVSSYLRIFVASTANARPLWPSIFSVLGPHKMFLGWGRG